MNRADVSTCGIFVRPRPGGDFEYGLRLPVWQTDYIGFGSLRWAGHISHVSEKVLGEAKTFTEAYNAAVRASKEPNHDPH